jgi:hypothetical protein
MLSSTFGLPVYPMSFTLVQIRVVRCSCFFQDMNIHCCWYCWNHTWNFCDIQYPTLHIQRRASRQVTWNECISFLKARCALVISCSWRFWGPNYTFTLGSMNSFVQIRALHCCALPMTINYFIVSYVFIWLIFNNSSLYMSMSNLISINVHFMDISENGKFNLLCSHIY